MTVSTTSRCIQVAHAPIARQERDERASAAARPAFREVWPRRPVHAYLWSLLANCSFDGSDESVDAFHWSGAQLGTARLMPPRGSFTSPKRRGIKWMWR